MSERIRSYLPYSGLIVLMLLLWLLKRTEWDGVVLLLREVLLIFGFEAALSDLREKRVPNRLVFAMLCAWLLIIFPQLFLQTERTLYLLLLGGIGSLVSGGLFLLVYCISRKGLGGGDVKLMTAAGLYLGFNGAMSAMLYGSILAAVMGGVLILFKKLGPKDTIPLVPFLYAGMVLAIFIQ